MEKFLRVGVIANTHGIKGEVKVYPTTDDLRRFDDLKKVFLDVSGEKKPLHISSVKYFKNMVILQFAEFKSIDEVEPFKGRDLFVAREDAVKLDEGEYFIADILDAEVYLEDGTYFGVLEDVLQTGANDVYCVKTPQGKEILIPSIPQCVISRDTENRKIVVRLLKGLEDL